MHRRGGLAAFDRQTQSLQSYAALGNEISQTQIDNLHAQLEQFRTALTRFAKDHREDIRKDPNFRQQFQQMCASIGVDPLAGPRRGGWWAELFNLGDWQYELGVQIVDVCVSTRERNGGLIEMGELIRIISKLRAEEEGGSVVTENDIARSIKTLEPLGAGYEVVRIGGRSMVRSVPKEFDGDQLVVLGIARELAGRVDEKVVVERTAWAIERTRTALDNMLNRDGLCWVDYQDVGDISYWVPSVMTWADEE